MVCLGSLCDPPLEARYRELLSGSDGIRRYSQSHGFDITECELPLIDLRGLGSGDERERRACVKEIAKASSEWGFFQVLNHGISSELLEEMRTEQMKAFKTTFDKKSSTGLLNGSYRWGNPSATSLDQFYWSEAFHFPLVKILEGSCITWFTMLRCP